jgi:hypothetical protein
MSIESETPASTPASTEAPQVGWWHRDHPTFTALSGFFTGLVFVCLVPAAFAGVLTAVFGSRRVEELFPLVLVMLVVPLVLVLLPRTRRFGTYMWLGIVTTAVVVVGVGGLVLWILISSSS